MTKDDKDEGRRPHEREFVIYSWLYVATVFVILLVAGAFATGVHLGQESGYNAGANFGADKCAEIFAPSLIKPKHKAKSP